MAGNEDNKTLNNRIWKLAPDAIDSMGDLMRDPNTPPPTRAQVIGFILERTLGKPDTTIHLTTAGGSVKDSERRLIAIAEEIRAENQSEFRMLDSESAEDDEEREDNTEEDWYEEAEDGPGGGCEGDAEASGADWQEGGV